MGGSSVGWRLSTFLKDESRFNCVRCSIMILLIKLFVVTFFRCSIPHGTSIEWFSFQSHEAWESFREEEEVGFNLKLPGEKHNTISTCSQLQTYCCGHQWLAVESVVATPGIEGPEFESWQTQGIYLFSKTPTPVLGLIHSPIKVEPGTLPPVARRPEGGGCQEWVEVYLYSFCGFISCTETSLRFIRYKELSLLFLWSDFQ